VSSMPHKSINLCVKSIPCMEKFRSNCAGRNVVELTLCSVYPIDLRTMNQSCSRLLDLIPLIMLNILLGMQAISLLKRMESAYQPTWRRIGDV
jgi:hypothetical protein